METLAAAESLQVPAPQLFSLKGKHAFITGGSRGIGAAMAHALVDAGASICLANRSASDTATADALRAKGARVEILECDLANMEDAKGIFQKAVDVMDGKIDIVVNCGGILKRKEAVSVTEEDWDSVSLCSSSSVPINKNIKTDTGQVIDVNLKALFLICQAAGRYMIPRRRGKIVNVASLNSFIGGETVASYSSSKGAVAQLTKALSNEWSKYNIQVNAIAPGNIATDM